MKHCLARPALLALCLALPGCATSPVEKQSAGHVIAPTARSIGLLELSAEWTPRETDIAQLEIALGRLFAHPDPRLRGLLTRDKKLPRRAPFPLSEYYVKYAGVTRDGQRLIIGKASHRGERTAAQALTLPTPNSNGDYALVLDVFGGGTAFFTVTYDPAARTVVDVVYHAPL